MGLSKAMTYNINSLKADVKVEAWKSHLVNLNDY